MFSLILEAIFGTITSPENVDQLGRFGVGVDEVVDGLAIGAECSTICGKIGLKRPLKYLAALFFLNWRIDGKVGDSAPIACNEAGQIIFQIEGGCVVANEHDEDGNEV